jgi:hypothetical protein
VKIVPIADILAAHYRIRLGQQFAAARHDSHIRDRVREKRGFRVSLHVRVWGIVSTIYPALEICVGSVADSAATLFGFLGFGMWISVFR